MYEVLDIDSMHGICRVIFRYDAICAYAVFVCLCFTCFCFCRSTDLSDICLIMIVYDVMFDLFFLRSRMTTQRITQRNHKTRGI